MLNYHFLDDLLFQDTNEERGSRQGEKLIIFMDGGKFRNNNLFFLTLPFFYLFRVTGNKFAQFFV